MHLLTKLTSLVHTFCTLIPHPISPKMSRKIQPSTSVVSWIHSSETQTATTWLPSRGRTRSKLKRVETFEKRTRSQLPPSSRYGHVGNKMHQNALFSLEFGVYIYTYIHMCMYVCMYIYITLYTQYIPIVSPYSIPISRPTHRSPSPPLPLRAAASRAPRRASKRGRQRPLGAARRARTLGA